MAAPTLSEGDALVLDAVKEAAPKGLLPSPSQVPHLRRLQRMGLVTQNAGFPPAWLPVETAEHEREPPDEASDSAPRPPGRSSRLVQLTTREGKATRRVVQILSEDCPDLYQRGGSIVRIQRDTGAELQWLQRPPGAPRIDRIPEPILRMHISDTCNLVSYSERQREWVPAHPPDWLIKQVATLGEWPFRSLEAVLETPFLRADGEVVLQPGYDRYSGVLLQPPHGVRWLPVPRDPTADQVRESLQRLLDLVQYFPWARPAGKSAWLAGLLSYVARYAFRGSVPAFLIDGNSPGTGKGKLQSATGLLLLGREMSRCAPTDDEDEMDKRLVSIAQSGDLLIKIDNIAGPWCTANLASALTDTEYYGRILGKNQRGGGPLNAIWWVNGNNLKFPPRLARDMVRRSLHMRLITELRRPEHRENLPDLLAQVTAERPRLIADLLTLLRGYYAAGKPKLVRELGGFEAWSAIVPQCCVWLGLPNPLDTQEDLIHDADPSEAVLGQLLEGWSELCQEEIPAGEVRAITTAEVLRLLRAEEEQRRIVSSYKPRFVKLYTAITELCPTPSGQLPTPHTLGNELRKWRDRRFRGQVLRVLPTRTAEGMLYTVEGEPED